MALETTPAPDTAEQARHEIEEEHRQLREALDRLGKTRDLAALVPQLDDLQELLVRHFAREEASDGLHAAVERTAPHKVNQLEHLFYEHRELLHQIEWLAASARECVDGPITAVLQGVKDITHKLHEHERAETDLFGEAVTEDLGAAG